MDRFWLGLGLVLHAGPFGHGFAADMQLFFSASEIRK